LRLDKDSIISWAWAAQCNDPVTKFVLVALAKLYDDSHCNVVATSRTLGSMTELGVSTVKKHLKKLEKEGFVTKESCLTLSGATASNKYSFNTHPSLPDDPQCLPDRLPYNNNNNIDTSNLVTIDTSNQLPLLDTSYIDTEWVKILKREMKYWPKALTPERTKTWAEDMESMYLVSLLVSESKTCQKWILTSRRKDITKVFSNWMKNASKNSTATTGSSSHSSDDKYAQAAKRQGGH
jgi:DNA-binding Lrp family transcriptional regulator